MKNLLNFIKENEIINDKNISRLYERKLLKTFDFPEYNMNVSGILNFIWKKNIYEVLICSDANDRIDRMIYKLFNSKDEAFAFYEKVYRLLFKINDEE